jgi:hypothetical protein
MEQIVELVQEELKEAVELTEDELQMVGGGMGMVLL